MAPIEARRFDEIRAGDSATLTRELTSKDLPLVAALFGEVDPAHVETWGAALISLLLATKLPGPGSVSLSQSLRFRRPITLGDVLTVSATVTAKDAGTRRMSFDCRCVNQTGEVVIEGNAEMLAPSVTTDRGTAPLAAGPASGETRHR